MTGFEVFQRPRAPKGAANREAAEHLQKIAEALNLAAEQVAATAQQIRPTTGGSVDAESLWDQTMADAIHALEQARQPGGSYGQQDRRPSGFRNAADYLRRMKNPYRKADQ